MLDHIKVPAIAPITRYNVNGSQTIFAYPFPIFASEDLLVYLDGAVQASGFTVEGAGVSAGGNVTFDNPPANGTIVTLERRLPIERITDFLEGGDFSAQAINNELDYMTASIQQVARDNDVMLKYSDHETPGVNELPDREIRANKALGFDGNGDPLAVSLEGAMASPDFTPIGTGAATRTSTDKFSDLISVKDFGAIGDGLADDTIAIQNALGSHDAVFIPKGEYLVTSTIAISARQSLIGAGNKSVIKAQSNLFNAIEIRGGFAKLSNLRIEGGDRGVLLYGFDGECVANALSDLHIISANIGIELDGYTDPAKPCYWNNFARIVIEQPLTHGVYLQKSGAGDTPNANRFHNVRVFSKGALTTGSGFYVQDGALNNSFLDCEANVNGPSADSCFRLGAGSNKTLLVNLLCESTNTVPNIKLDSGSLETSIINLSAQSDGAAILDNSGGNYDAINAGYPEKNRMRKTVVTDLKATLMSYDTEYIDTSGSVTLDDSHSVHLVSSFGGALTVNLPDATTVPGVTMSVKKVDTSSNIITVGEDGAGAGPDGKSIQLGGENDYVSVISNGTKWYIIASNRMSENTRYFDGSGTYDIDMAVDTYLLSSFGGAMISRLPPANASQAIGRTITIKKIDNSANTITVTEQGGAGPDQSAQVLSSQYSAITLTSNGGQWYIVSKHL